MKPLDSKGFGSLNLMVIVSLVLSLLAGGAWVGRQLFEWNSKHHFCHVSALEHQNELRTFLLQILRLNPKAKRLLTQEGLAKVALAAAVSAGNPAGISAASRRLQKIRLEQKALAAQQKVILGLARASAQKFKKLQGSQKNHKNLRLLTSPGPNVYPLAVRPEPPNAAAPQYLPVADFSEKQNIGIRFSTDLSNWNFMAQFFSPQNSRTPLNLQIECGSTLRKENNKWFTHLSEARPSSKLSQQFSY